MAENLIKKTLSKNTLTTNLPNPCKYGATCTRINIEHKREFTHPYDDTIEYLEMAFNTFNASKPLISEIEMLRDEKLR